MVTSECFLLVEPCWTGFPKGQWLNRRCTALPGSRNPCGDAATCGCSRVGSSEITNQIWFLSKWTCCILLYPLLVWLRRGAPRAPIFGNAIGTTPEIIFSVTSKAAGASMAPRIRTGSPMGPVPVLVPDLTQGYPGRIPTLRRLQFCPILVCWPLSFSVFIRFSQRT